VRNFRKPKASALAEGAALCAAFAGHILAAAAHAHTLSLTLAVVVIGAVLGFAVNGGVRGGIGAHRVGGRAAALLIGLAAGLVAAGGAGALHLDAGQIAEAVHIMAAGRDRAFQFVFHDVLPQCFQIYRPKKGLRV